MLCQLVVTIVVILFVRRMIKKPVGLALISLRKDSWADINMTRLNDLPGDSKRNF